MQKIYILVGSSGSGKTTLMEELTKRNPGFAIVKSVTTRKPRGVPEPNYRFVSPEEFENLKKEAAFWNGALTPGTVTARPSPTWKPCSLPGKMP